MNSLILALALAASGNFETEMTIRLTASDELGQMHTEVRENLNREMTEEVRTQLKLRMEEETAAALMAESTQLLAAEPAPEKR